MTPEQHRAAAAELILDGARDGHRLSVLKHLELSGVEHTAEDAKAIFELIHNATITMEFPEREFTSTPYVSTLLAEIDKLNDELGEAMSILAKVGDAISPTGERPEEALGTLAQDVEDLVDQRDAARREANVAANTAIRFHHRVLQLEAQLAEVNDRCDQTAAARERFRRERDAERNARAATLPQEPSPPGFAFTLAERGLAVITGNACCGGNGVEASCEVCRRD